MSTSGVTTAALNNTTRGLALCTADVKFGTCSVMRNTIGLAVSSVRDAASLPPGTDGSHIGTENAPVPCSSSACQSSADLVLNQVTNKLVSAMSTIPVRSNSIYISNFDPSFNDFDIWCEEVDSARLSNYWDDRECLSQIGYCLKGDVKVWLNGWLSNDRSWSNFKKGI
ncbi:unnamed protein product [Pieris macdunnoughi]|uniref:Uncharacterized protein n=1 Tax=Pieris macdunnoughi TaxID=345717 RepID=A0A821LIS9_9NEOP|nr:unnamed protein product [Pieris macdunnoughi]